MVIGGKRIRLITTWEERDSDGFNRTLCFGYEQQDNRIYNFHVYSDGFPGTKLSDYTSLDPLKVDTFSKVMRIVPIETLRNICLVDEENWVD